MAARILIPVKALGEGKSRLAPVLDAEGRRRLCEGFLRQTLRLAVGLAPTLVVTRDREARRIAVAAGAAAIDEPTGSDLNRALDLGRRAALGADALLVVPIDLPRLEPATLTGLLADPRRFTIAPDQREDGTNLLLLPRAAMADFRFAFGPGSFKAHCDEAARLGLEPAILRLADAAFDVDAPEDYAALSAEPAR
jgi:2-phospho-L-lactate guanylyltransferase